MVLRSISLEATDMSIRPITIPKLVGAAILDTKLALEQVAQVAGEALGIKFEKDIEGIYEEKEALITFALGHILAIFEENSLQFGEERSRLILELRGGLDPIHIGLHLEEYEIIYLRVDEYLAALLRIKTGLPFEANPPRKSVSR
jgi:hypothetical protein